MLSHVMLIWIENFQCSNGGKRRIEKIKNGFWIRWMSDQRRTAQKKQSCHRNYINNEQTFDLKAFKHISHVMKY